jgi:IclR family transcriptional regulator, KDG regulon repressor
VYKAPIARQVVELIRLMVGEHRPLGVSEIARKLSLHKSTAFGLLKGLTEIGYIDKDDDKRYLMGDKLFELVSMISQRADVTIIARPYMERLADEIKETVFLGMQEDDGVVIFEVVHARSFLRLSSPAGARLPLTAGAPGKVILSALPDEYIIDLIRKKGLRQSTEQSITETNRFLAEIASVRELGYGLDLEEYLTGVRAVAVPVKAGNSLLAVLWVAGFSQSLTDSQLPRVIEHVIDAAAAIGETVLAQLTPLRQVNVHRFSAPVVSRPFFPTHQGNGEGSLRETVNRRNGGSKAAAS